MYLFVGERPGGSRDCRA